MTDFRSNRMPTNEGRGRARAAWNSYANWVNRNVTDRAMPAIRPLVERHAVNKATELIGFWVMWHAYGGYEGLIEQGMAPTTIYRKVKGFRMMFKAHPDEYDFPGLARPNLKEWHAPVATEP